MDFASLMSAQIAKAASKPTSNQSTAAPPKYIKRADLEAAREKEYAAAQHAAAQARAAKQAEKRKLQEDEAAERSEREAKRARLAEQSRLVREKAELEAERARRRRIGLPDLPDPSTTSASNDEKKDDDVPDDELIERLRALGHPARLFGETHGARLKRFKKLAELAAAPKMSSGPVPTTLALVPEADMLVPDKVPTDDAGKAYLYRQLGSYFTMVLTEWTRALNARDEGTKKTTAGTAASHALLQASVNMEPLFRRLEQQSLEASVLGAVTEIVRCCQQRRYVAANDAYLRLSIGKAAWPIGVTMVGIHERSAREKLHSHEQDAAHIMADEGTRKWLQSIKRCLTYAQTRWPPEDGGWA